MLAHTVGQFFCMWRGFLLDEIKSEGLFKVQQQSLKGTERSESMCDLQHKQVPQQVSSAHAPTECFQITETSCVLLLLVPLRRLKVSRSVTSSHRCLQAKGILLYYIKTSYSWIYFLLASAAVSLFSTFQICLTSLPFFSHSSFFFPKLAMISLFHASFLISFCSLIEDSLHCSHCSSSWSRVSAMLLCVHKFCLLTPRFWISICPNAKLHIHSHLSCLFLIQRNK